MIKPYAAWVLHGSRKRLMASRRVALALPFYASVDFADAAMNTLLRQDYDNYKIFAVSDGARPELLKIIQAWEQVYPEKIQIFEQENMGTGGALNTAFDAINREGGYDYGTMVSADNLYKPRFVSTLVDALDRESDDIVMVYGDFIYVNQHDAMIHGPMVHEDLGREHLVDEYKVGPAFMFRMWAKNKAGPYWRRICEDYANAVLIGQFGQFKAVNEMLMEYRLSLGQLTGSDPVEERRALAYCQRLARKLYFCEDSRPEDVYPPGVDPFMHRFDHEGY